MKNKMKITASMLAFVALLVVTTGVTLAYYSYKGVGKTENTISVGGITFHYKEINGKGHGISITDALPVASNEDAKLSDKYFDFKITSTTMDGVTIPYIVTARMDNGSDSILGNIIDIYLTEVNGNSETPTALFAGEYVKYNELEDYEFKGSYTEKVIYTDTVSSTSYEKNFRLRMWIDQNTNLNTGNGQSNYNNKTFSITVNVNAKGSATANNTQQPVNKFCRFVDGTFGSEGNVGAKYLCDPGDGVERYFYILAVDGNDVEMIMEENLSEYTETKLMDWSTASNFFESGEGKTIRDSWTNVNSIDLPGAQEIANAVGNTSWTIRTAQQDARFFITPDGTGNYVQSPTANASNKSQYRWLFNYLPGCTDFGCDSETDSNTITGKGYWTRDAVNGRPDAVWTISGAGMMAPPSGTTNNYYGLRPVINVIKSNIGLTDDATSTPSFGEPTRLNQMIIDDNPVIKTKASLNSPSTRAVSENGLFKLNTNNGFGGIEGSGTTYYFRGDVTNNVVRFADKLWRVVRINEDGTVRLILDTNIVMAVSGYDYNEDYTFSYPSNKFKYMYYSNTNEVGMARYPNTKNSVDKWYNENITGTNASKVATGNYFCEAAKVKFESGLVSGDATMEVYNRYTPTLNCEADLNGNQFITEPAGLLTFEEAMYAGAGVFHVDYPVPNKSFYLYKGINGDNNYNWWFMSPAAYNSRDGIDAREWLMSENGAILNRGVASTYKIRPVINLKADTTATKEVGTGYYVVD